MTAVLRVRLGRARDGGPLATVEGLPGDGAELRPHDLRALADMLLRVASDCEARKTTHRRGRALPDERRTYLAQP